MSKRNFVVQRQSLLVEETVVLATSQADAEKRASADGERGWLGGVLKWRRKSRQTITVKASEVLEKKNEKNPD